MLLHISTKKSNIMVVIIFCYGLALLCIVVGLININISFTKKSLPYLLLGLFELSGGIAMQSYAMGL